MDTKYGFFQLALLYALINNTVCKSNVTVQNVKDSLTMV